MHSELINNVTVGCAPGNLSNIGLSIKHEGICGNLTELLRIGWTLNTLESITKLTGWYMVAPVSIRSLLGFPFTKLMTQRPFTFPANIATTAYFVFGDFNTRLDGRPSPSTLSSYNASYGPWSHFDTYLGNAPSLHNSRYVGDVRRLEERFHSTPIVHGEAEKYKGHIAKKCLETKQGKTKTSRRN
ncbi:hypothetical protein J6590_025126 [Homalodisca vitripennis]|nr:hypothetical protein J6590_025126 [Homalodisca vitripennis]